MYYSFYMNERLALENWEKYNECNWLLSQFLSKDETRSVEERLDYYISHRKEKDADEDDNIRFANDYMRYIYGNWQEYERKKFFYEMYLEDLNESGEDMDMFEHPDIALVEWQEDRFLEKMGDRFFKKKSFLKQLESGESFSMKTYEWRNGEQESAEANFIHKMMRNSKMNAKLREVDKVTLYKSDFSAIEKAKRDHRLTELQVQLLFGLIFFSRLNGVKFCRIGTRYKLKSFKGCFNRTITEDDFVKVLETGLISIVKSDKSEVINKFKKQAQYLNIKSEYDYAYEGFDVQDGGIGYEFITTVENNKLNLTAVAKEAMSNYKVKYCIHCGCEFQPKSNRQQMCETCKKEVVKEQNRIRQEKFRQKGK